MIRTWRNRNSHSLFVGTQSDIATLEDNLTIPYKIKCIPAIRSISNAPKYFHPNHRKIITQMFITVLFIIVIT